jgi:alpha-L-arabinofuranosidase
MFGKSAGNYYYGDCVKIDGATNLQGQSVVLNTKTRQLFVKICNASDEAKRANIDLSRFKGMKSQAVKTVISGQAQDENNYDAQPIQPKEESIKASKKMTLDIAPYSFTMLQINL